VFLYVEWPCFCRTSEKRSGVNDPFKDFAAEKNQFKSLPFFPASGATTLQTANAANASTNTEIHA
jgi:hypothetical protein